MKPINSFIIIGGDSRQIYMAEHLDAQGYNISVYGLPETQIRSVNNLKKEIEKSDAIILPLPVTKDGMKIQSIIPVKETVDEIISFIRPEQAVFAGMISKGLEMKITKRNADVYDYFKREDVTVMNTVPTVQGILKVIIENIDYTIFSSKCAVFGYGRVSRITAEALSSLGADITVCARKYGDLAAAKIKGFNGCLINEFSKEANKYNIIINTVPSIVIDNEILKKVRKDCLIIDVASSPFGVDFTAAYELGIKALQCSSLPGKVAPKTAGKIIADGIMNIIKEENNE